MWWAERQARERSEAAHHIREGLRAEMRSQARFNLRDLGRWTGVDDGPILLSVDGLVFDVTDGREFYAPGGSYNALVGCDATRLLAKGLLEQESASERKAPLSVGERQQLMEWKEHFDFKYGPALGPLDMQDEEASHKDIDHAGTDWRSVQDTTDYRYDEFLPQSPGIPTGTQASRAS